MIGSLLVFGFVLISVITAFAFYFNYVWIKLSVLALLFIWSSSVFFLLTNYEGWPSKGDYPRSRVIAIEVVDPTQIAPGRIFVWVYHVNQVVKKFYEYNPDDTPRGYEIPYTEAAANSFKKAGDKLEKGFIIYMGKNEGEEGFGDGEGSGNIGGDGGGGDLTFPYERDKPPIEAINPQKLMPAK